MSKSSSPTNTIQTEAIQKTGIRYTPIRHVEGIYKRNSEVQSEHGSHELKSRFELQKNPSLHHALEL